MKLVTGPHPTKGGSHYGIVDLDPILKSSTNFIESDRIFSSTITFILTVCVALLSVAALVMVYTKDMRLRDRSTSSAYTHEYTAVA